MGWISRPPTIVTISFPTFLRERLFVTSSGWSLAMWIALSYPRKSGAWSIATWSTWLSIHSPQ